MVMKFFKDYMYYPALNWWLMSTAPLCRTIIVRITHYWRIYIISIFYLPDIKRFLVHLLYMVFKEPKDFMYIKNSQTTSVSRFIYLMSSASTPISRCINDSMIAETPKVYTYNFSMISKAWEFQGTCMPRFPKYLMFPVRYDSSN